MRTLLFSMLLACGSKDEDGSSDEVVENEDPKWFEAGTYECTGDCGWEPTLYIHETGSITTYEFVRRAPQNGVKRYEGECLIQEAITPDESVWEAECDFGGIIETVRVYSDGFRVDWTYWVSGVPYAGTFE